MNTKDRILDTGGFWLFLVDSSVALVPLYMLLGGYFPMFFEPGLTTLAAVVLVWPVGWLMNINLIHNFPAISAVFPALIFGITLLIIWELLIIGLDVSPVIVPPPSLIAARFVSSTDILWADFLQTMKGMVAGYVIGCTVGFLTAIAIDRSPFLTRGLLPIGNLVAALPIIGVAPIMVMWYGFDWQSKAAVVVIMCFFPMLVNTVEGLQAADRMQKDLMRTYAASYTQALMKLRLPAAGPFIFNGLKICSTLALIGAIVAEFFGTPIVGMGFRISTEVGRMNVDMVWAEITVAAIVGSSFYGIVALIERTATFWHPSQRGK
jgi:NitT/TauT family transport system permease protein